MSDRDKISAGIRRLLRRRRAQLILDAAVRGLFWGSILAALAIFAGKLWLLPVDSYILAAVLLILTVGCFKAVAMLRPVTTLAVAGEIDHALGLRERVSSAVALGDETAKRDPFVKALLRDAARSVEQAEMRRVFPWRLPRAWRIALPALLIAGSLSFLPQLNWFVNSSDRAEAQQVQNEGQKLKELARQIKKEAEERQDPVLREQAKEIERVGTKLERPNIKKKEALKELQKLENKLLDGQQALIPPGEQKLSAELAKQLKEMRSTAELGELLEQGKTAEFGKQLEQLLEKLQAGKMSPQALEQMQDLVKALEEALKSDAAGMQDAEHLKENLEALKDALANVEQMREALEQALQNFQRDLDKLTDNLDKNNMGQQAQQLEQLAQQMQEEFAQNGAVSEQTLSQMEQALQQAQQQIDGNQSLSSQAKAQLSQQVQQALSHLQGQQSEGQQGQAGEGQLSQMNQQMAQAMQQMSQQAQQSSECMGGN